MSALSHAPIHRLAGAGVPAANEAGRCPPLRLLERPVRAQPVVAAPSPSRSVADWCVRQVERFWAWGEGAQHHRLGSWLRH